MAIPRWMGDSRFFDRHRLRIGPIIVLMTAPVILGILSCACHESREILSQSSRCKETTGARSVSAPGAPPIMLMRPTG